MAKKKNAARADGRIAVQVYLGRGVDGKRQYKTVYGATQKEADKKAEEVKLAMRKGLDVAAERDTFEEWAERWKKIKKREVSGVKFTVYCNALKHLYRGIGHMPISKLRTADIQDVIIDLADKNPNTGKPTASETLKTIKSAASQVLQLAIDNRVIDHNPATAVKISSKGERSDRRALTADEQSWIEQMPHRAQCAAMIMMHAGLRRGELIPLLWSDIDLKARTISVNKSVEIIKSHFAVKDELKSDASRRVVDIPQKLADFLVEQPRASVLVCPRTNGAIHTQSSWEKMWGTYMLDLNIRFGDFGPFRVKKNGKPFMSKYDPEGVPLVIPKFTPHWLRHTFATNLYLAGVDILTAKEQLGHANIATTLEIYTHLDAQHKRRSMDKLDAFFGACKSDASQAGAKGQ